jgi:hypothetical protein
MQEFGRVWPPRNFVRGSFGFTARFAGRGAAGWSGRGDWPRRGWDSGPLRMLAGRKCGPFAAWGRDAREANCRSRAGWRGLSFPGFQLFPNPRRSQLSGPEPRPRRPCFGARSTPRSRAYGPAGVPAPGPEIIRGGSCAPIDWAFFRLPSFWARGMGANTIGRLSDLCWNNVPTSWRNTLRRRARFGGSS